MSARALAAWMAPIVAALAAAAAFAQAPAAGSLPDADWREIRSIVEAQRAALVAGDAARAYGYASPGIREKFVDADTFLEMVRQAYAPLVDARDAVLLEGAVIEGHVIQPLRLVLPDNTVMVALYTMEKLRGGGWRIAGCVIAPSTLKAV